MARNNMAKVKLTKESKDNLFDNCDFNNVDFDNEGERNKVKDSRFRGKILQGEEKQKGWHTTWWGILILMIIGGVVIAGVVYFVGWN